MSNIKSRIPKESTVEGLIEGLDQRGLLVFLVLLGKQAMDILSNEVAKEVPKSNILVPNTDNKLLPSNANTNLIMSN